MTGVFIFHIGRMTQDGKASAHCLEFQFSNVAWLALKAWWKCVSGMWNSGRTSMVWILTKPRKNLQRSASVDIRAVRICCKARSQTTLNSTSFGSIQPAPAHSVLLSSAQQRLNHQTIPFIIATPAARSTRPTRGWLPRPAKPFVPRAAAADPAGRVVPDPDRRARTNSSRDETSP